MLVYAGSPRFGDLDYRLLPRRPNAGFIPPKRSCPIKDGEKEAVMHLDSSSNRNENRFVFSNLSRPDTLVELDPGQSWGVRGKRRQQTIFCLHGSVWVTQECDIRDYVLEAGDAFLIDLPGLVLVMALESARIGYAMSVVPAPFRGRFSQTVFN